MAVLFSDGVLQSSFFLNVGEGVPRPSGTEPVAEPQVNVDGRLKQNPKTGICN